jgi:cytoskeletal protein CcmA (bactofilin family)
MVLRERILGLVRRLGATSVIGAGMRVTGDVASGGRLHVDGEVAGDVRGAVLSQGAGGAIRGDVFAQDARLAGSVDGRVEAARLVLDSSARIAGDLHYGTIAIAAGAQVSGRLVPRAGAVEVEAPPPAPEPLVEVEVEIESEPVIRAELKAPAPRRRRSSVEPELFALPED